MHGGRQDAQEELARQLPYQSFHLQFEQGREHLGRAEPGGLYHLVDVQGLVHL